MNFENDIKKLKKISKILDKLGFIDEKALINKALSGLSNKYSDSGSAEPRRVRLKRLRKINQ